MFGALYERKRKRRWYGRIVSSFPQDRSIHPDTGREENNA